MFFITLFAAVVVLAVIDLPAIQRKEEVLWNKYNDRRKHKRINWQELGYQEHAKVYYY